MISFVVPAYNEAFEIERCLSSIFNSAQKLNQPFEVVVVNDASTDRTRPIAEAAGARVVDVHLRKISAVRNAGARAAKGDVFFFVDADTQISEPLLRAALHSMEQGAVGGGAWVDFSEHVNFLLRMSLYAFGFLYARLLGWAAGCLVFVKRSAFEAVGGFDESLYATEEIFLSLALKRIGRFVVLREGV